MNIQKTNKGEKKDEFFLVTSIISRKVAYPIAVFFCKLGVSANIITIVGGCMWIISAVSIVLSGWLLVNNGSAEWGYLLLILTLILWNLGYILDVADGSVARITGTANSAGYFLDFVFHLIFQPMYFCTIGVFLYLITGSLFYLVLGVLSICAGWGVSFGAKEHVLCEHIAKKQTNIDKFKTDELYRIYIDSVRTRTPAVEKKGWLLFRSLVEEMICFPGQYSTMSVLVVADLIACYWINTEFLFFKTGFIFITTITLFRVPFRIHREFKTMNDYDKIRTGKQ